MEVLVTSLLSNHKRSQLLTVSETTTVEDVSKNYPGSSGLLFNGRRLSSGRLYNHGIRPRCTLIVTAELPGGGGPTYRDVRIQRARQLKQFLLRSTEPSMISLDDDEPAAQMSCGHPMSPGDMHEYCMNELSAKKTDFVCPDPGCKQVWGFMEVYNVADWDRDELEYVEKMLNQNYITSQRGIRQCPFCNSYSKRIDEKNPRVICGVCKVAGRKPFEFCWDCLRQWNNQGNRFCGNANCQSDGGFHAALRNCPTKQIGDVKGVPQRRACPKCRTLIEHIKACKQMTCPAQSCGHKFCFICLIDYKNWAEHAGNCSVAPRQLFA